MALSTGQLVWNGQSHKTWALHDTGLPWQAYVKAIRKGDIWPGILEIQILARLLKVILEVYVKEGTTYKRIAKLHPEDNTNCPVWRLDYQDGKHFEPLVPVIPNPIAPTAVAAGTADDNHTPPIQASHATPAEEEPACTPTSHTVLLANVSFLRKHGDELYAVASAYGADTIMVTETRLAQDTKLVKHKARDKGYHICCSQPRPPKASGGGPNDGGVAILNRTAAPDVVATQCPVATLSADDALHSVIPIDNNFSVHVIVAYCPKPCETLRESLFRYAASLGDVPIIIGADWNVEASESRAVAEAISTGYWVDAAVLLANNGDPTATDVAQAPTTHRAGTQGRRVDYFLANAAAQPIVSEVFIVKDLPLINHFAVGLRLNDQTESVQQSWSAIFNNEQQHWTNARLQGDVDNMWAIWTRTAENALSN
ncbi:unnamed protein product, partial [Symbiodinium sp. CCMP2456]